MGNRQDREHLDRVFWVERLADVAALVDLHNKCGPTAADRNFLRRKLVSVSRRVLNFEDGGVQDLRYWRDSLGVARTIVNLLEQCGSTADEREFVLEKIRVIGEHILDFDEEDDECHSVDGDE